MRAWIAIALCCCVEHGERPTRCEPDVVLAGPGSTDTHDVVVGDGSTEICLEVDGRGHADPVLRVATPLRPTTLEVVLALREPDGDVMTTSRPPLVWAMPAGYLSFARLELVKITNDGTEAPLEVTLEIVSGSERRDTRGDAERVQRVDGAPAALE